MSLEINQRVKAERIKKGYTQSQMANLLNMKCTTYSQMERSGNITCDKIVEIAKFLNVDVRILLYGEIKNKSIKIIKPHQKTKSNRYYPTPKLTDSEKSIIKILRNLSKHKRDKCISFIENEYKN